MLILIGTARMSSQLGETAKDFPPLAAHATLSGTRKASEPGGVLVSVNLICQVCQDCDQYIRSSAPHHQALVGNQARLYCCRVLRGQISTAHVHTEPVTGRHAPARLPLPGYILQGCLGAAESSLLQQRRFELRSLKYLSSSPGTRSPRQVCVTGSDVRGSAHKHGKTYPPLEMGAGSQC